MYRVPLKIHFGGQTTLFVAGGVRQKPLYYPNKSNLSSRRTKIFSLPLKSN